MVPTYNNAGTILDVLRRIAAITQHIIVVVDGCTDDTRERLKGFTDAPLVIVDHAENKGKGAALLSGFKCAILKGYEYAITIDADGLRAMKEHPEAFIIGSRNLKQENMSGGSSFANHFSNFWFAVQTGIRLPDTQTGYRLYPLRNLSGVHLITSRYEAELELLVFAAWAGATLIPVPVRVYYPPKNRRVSHFRPVTDFLRITVLNTAFCLVAIFYGWPRTLWIKLRGKR